MLSFKIETKSSRSEMWAFIGDTNRSRRIPTAAGSKQPKFKKHSNIQARFLRAHTWDEDFGNGSGALNVIEIPARGRYEE